MGRHNKLNQLTNRAFSGSIPVYGTVQGTNADLGVKVMGREAQLFNSTNPAEDGTGFLGHAPLTVQTNQGAYTVSVVATNAAGFQTNRVFNVYLPPKNPQALLYDLNGNLTNDGIYAYFWNNENRLVKIEPLEPASDKVKMEFAYDGQGRRFKRVRYSGWNGSAYTVTNETRYVYDSWRVIAELNAENEVEEFYTWGLDLSGTFEGLPAATHAAQAGAGGIGGLIGKYHVEDGSNGRYVYFYDGNGNVMQVYKDNGVTCTARYDYDPFGRLTKIWESSELASAGSNPFRFSTKLFESDFGVYYYGYRSYSPELGRWLSRDPIGEHGGVNVYRIAANQVANAIDPFGLDISGEKTLIVMDKNYPESQGAKTRRIRNGSFDIKTGPGVEEEK